MAEFVADCPHCEAKHVTFQVIGDHCVGTNNGANLFEVASFCRECRRSWIFGFESDLDKSASPTQCLNQPALRARFKLLGPAQRLRGSVHPTPKSCPEDVTAAFEEGAICFSEGCWSAAGVMFRKSLDLATRDLLPPPPSPRVTYRIRRDLKDRLMWLFNNGYLPGSLRGLAEAVREDGNDGAHAEPLEETDAADLQDFARVFLERIYTEPAQIKAAEERRVQRRGGGAKESPPEV